MADQDSIQTVISDGTLKQLAISLVYISRTEISVYFGTELQVEGTDWAWLGDNENVIEFTDFVPDGTVVMVRRTTNIDEVLHVFSLGAKFDAVEVDENFQQLLRAMQDQREGVTSADYFGNIDMHGYLIKNLGTAVDDTDALSMGQYKADADGAYASREEAEAARDIALDAADRAREYALETHHDQFATNGTGTPNAIVATMPSDITVDQLYDRLVVYIRMKDVAGGNTVRNPTLELDSTGAQPITKGHGTPLRFGDINGQDCIFRWNATDSEWELLNPAWGQIQAAAEDLALLMSSTGDPYWGVPFSSQGGRAGQVLMISEGGAPVWRWVTGVPIGSLSYLPYDDAPRGFVRISYRQESVVSLLAIPKASVCACPSDINAEADFFYRCDNPDGTVRNPDGNWLVLPAADRYYFRGFDTAGSILDQYKYIPDQVGPHVHPLPLNTIPAVNNAPYAAQIGYAGGDETSLSETGLHATAAAPGVNRQVVVPTAYLANRGLETSPKSIGGFRVFIKLWNGIENDDGIDYGAELATMEATREAKLTPDYIDDMTAIVYPTVTGDNGSSDNLPLTANSGRYYCPNPFPGFHVHCEAQVLYDGLWADPGWGCAAVNTGYGTRASHCLPEDEIVVQVGVSNAIWVANCTGNLFRAAAANNTGIQFRVIVTKMGYNTTPEPEEEEE